MLRIGATPFLTHGVHVSTARQAVTLVGLSD